MNYLFWGDFPQMFSVKSVGLFHHLKTHSAQMTEDFVKDVFQMMKNQKSDEIK